MAAAFLSPVVRRRDTPDLVIGFLASIVAGVIVVEMSTNLRKVLLRPSPESAYSSFYTMLNWCYKVLSK